MEVARQVSRLVIAACAGVLAIAPACLESLPEPLSCPDEARFAPVMSCPPAQTTSAPVGAPAPSPAGGQCSLALPCLQAQGRTCLCGAEGECAPRSECSPPPDCPPSIRSRTAGAVCHEVTASLAASLCACGCGSCAAACDGYGPVVGAGAELTVTLPALPTSGRLGFMVRARGAATLTAAFGGALPVGAAPPMPPTATVAPSPEFTDVFMNPGIVLNGRAPTSLKIMPTAQIEIDCVVPFYAP